ncbi:hypothetical protein H9Y04_44820 [Streptomyces sp. TRM66268-LWL]|uniref:Uncharacterized protein n=1 Tax=Streptomyces polyasparticus TaxID=2767826 RepID=A0ABR7SZC2_9ACTN|nr:hypothetical protein [Streptomyces polyasparticus]MBC9719618.1 hypothetical protein [Streptomyces polyasparticus]
MLVQLINKRTALAAVPFVGLTLYSSSAWFVGVYGDVWYPPFPTPELVASVSNHDIRATIVAYGMMEICFGAARVHQRLAVAFARTRDALADCMKFPPVRIVVFATLAVLGAMSWMSLLQVGVAEVLASERRTYASALAVGTDQNLQLPMIAASIIAMVGVVNRQHRWISLTFLAFCWTPFILVGSRKELILAGGAVAFLVLRNVTWRKVLLPLLAAVGFIIAPVLYTGDIFDAFHEFVLPQHLHFSIAMREIPADFAGSFWDRSQFLIPGPVRPGEPIVFGEAFYRFGISNVAYGGSIYAEAESLVGFIPHEIVFAILVNALIFLALTCRSFAPALSVTVWASLLTLGRSDFWIALFFITYLAILLQLAAWVANDSSNSSWLEANLSRSWGKNV